MMGSFPEVLMNFESTSFFFELDLYVHPHSLIKNFYCQEAGGQQAGS